MFTMKESEARAIMGDEMFGTDEAKQLLGGKLDVEIPPIMASEEALVFARERGQQLILQVDKTPKGEPISIRTLNRLLGGKTSYGDKFLYISNGGEISDDARYKDEPFMDVPLKKCWRLTGKEVLVHSKGVDYLDQTDALIEELSFAVSRGVFDSFYAEAVMRFGVSRSKIRRALQTNWREAADMLESLAITHLVREAPNEVGWRLAFNAQCCGVKQLSDIWAWTSVRDSYGFFVRVGYFDAEGASVGRNGPGSSRGNLGASFSRMVS